ncbi:MAG TPA: hypothetical protein VEV83_00845 [Parafilimonas sp.]|nr:hypothetical protein [Parafilimonas sp.]
MARENYILSNNSNDVSIEVNVSTPGIAITKVFKITPVEIEEIKRSEDGTGDIEPTDIDKASTLNNTLIKITEDIDLKNVAQDLWQSCFDNLVIQYTMRGGINGAETFTCKNEEKSQSNNKRFIGCEKRIFLSIA